MPCQRGEGGRGAALTLAADSWYRTFRAEFRWGISIILPTNSSDCGQSRHALSEAVSAVGHCATDDCRPGPSPTHAPGPGSCSIRGRLHHTWGPARSSGGWTASRQWEWSWLVRGQAL